MRSHFIWVAAGLLLSSVPATASTIVYNNLSGSTSATSGGSAGITSNSNGPLGDSFSTGVGGSFLSDVMLSLSASTPGDGKSLTVSLLSNAANSPGTLLYTLGTVADSSLMTSLKTVDVPIGLSIGLAANTRYWIELSTTGSSRWSYDATNVGVGVANEYNYYAGSSSPNSSFTPYQMEVTTSATAPTPEPSTLSLLGLGCAGVAFLRRRLTKV